MGGNTKITIEMARNLPKLGWEVAVVVPDEKKLTFTDNIGEVEGVTYCTYPRFPGNEIRKAFSSPLYHYRQFKATFEKLQVSADDIVYCNCNFHFEVIPLVLLKRKFRYRYLPSHYLFSPFVVENLMRHYRLPVVKWFAVWLYERFFFLIAKMAADGFVITNDVDRCHFPQSFQKRILPIYGGVNVDQIPTKPTTKTRDAVFCSRLHPQKGVEGLIEIWAEVVKSSPDAKLSIIGNGDDEYEQYLHGKAQALDIDGSIEWLGYVNNEAKYEIYRSAKLFIHSTVFDNNGMVAAEALCSGLPVVMYDLPALRKVYTEGCVKIPYGDQKKFADEIVKLTGNELYRNSIAPNAESLEKLRQLWDWPNRAKLFSAFLEMLNG